MGDVKPMGETESAVAPPPAAPLARDRDELAADIQSLRRELSAQMTRWFAAVAIAGAALLVAVTTPMWGPRIVANDPQSVRTLALATAYLGRLAETSRPFAADLALLRRSLPKDAQINAIMAALEPLASASVPTVADLAGRLNSMASDVFVGKVVGNDGWVNSSVTRIASFARIESLATTVAPRHTGEEVALVHAAEQAIERGDLRAAVEKLEKLDGQAKETAAPWLAAAKQRLLLDAKVAELGALAVVRSTTPANFVLP